MITPSHKHPMCVVIAPAISWARAIGRKAQYFSVKRILVEILETCRTGSAGRCDLLAYNQVHARRACTRLPSHDRVFEGHGFRELIAATSAAGTTNHTQPFC